jgi:DNA-binding response OmpR family regulator
MDKLRLDQVDLMLVDPDLNIRHNVKNILHGCGFREIRYGKTLREIRDGIVETMPDLLICEAVFEDGDFCDLLYALRHHQIGSNPFMPVIAMTWDPTPELVKRVVEAGADDLLAKPISTGQLQDRIQNLIDTRKPFVVTSDYIGPDRRTDSTRATAVPLLDVPNTLRAKATGEDQKIDMQKAIDEAIGNVNLQKLDRHAFQINWLLNQVLPKLEEGQTDEAVQGMLERLLYVAEDSSRRMVGTEYAHVSELCRSLIKVTNAVIEAGNRPNSKDVRLLRPLAQAIQVGFATGAAATAREISASIGS